MFTNNQTPFEIEEGKGYWMFPLDLTSVGVCKSLAASFRFEDTSFRIGHWRVHNSIDS